MDTLLQRAQVTLAEYDFHHPASAELPALADALDSAAASDDAIPSSIAHLPEVLLLRLAELLRIGPACVGDAEDLGKLPSPSDTTSHLLHDPPHVRLPLLRHLLTSHFPRYFKPHAKLHPSTGRVLNRPLGGEAGAHEWHEDGEGGWRREGGLAGVVALVIGGLEPGEIEDVWPLLLPPLLAYLDDYDPAHKILGLSILDGLLETVDAALLRRTGVGKVFEQCLRSCFSALSHPLSAPLLASAHPVALTLVRRLHPDEAARFDALSALVSESIVPAWEFKAGHVAIETVSARALPRLLGELGRGSVRWLQVVVPHLCGLLDGGGGGGGGGGTSVETLEMQLEAARALRHVVELARGRMARWEARVVAALGRCWVELREEGREGTSSTRQEHAEVHELAEALRAVVRALDEVPRAEAKASRLRKSLLMDLRALDEGLFGELVGPREVMAQ
ncbi:hypothetical protein JCM21900_003490 [Sporobolomyces salmonicolor]